MLKTQSETTNVNLNEYRGIAGSLHISHVPQPWRDRKYTVYAQPIVVFSEAEMIATAKTRAMHELRNVHAQTLATSRCGHPPTAAQAQSARDVHVPQGIVRSQVMS